MKRMICVAAVIMALSIITNCRAEVSAVYLTPHFHYDPVFQEDQNDYTDVGFDRVRRFSQCLRDDPYYDVVFSEIDYLKPYFDVFPDEREFLLDAIAKHRIETGGSYNEPNEMNISGEGIIRNILYGRAYHEGVLGDTRALVYMPFDVFGHTLQLSQILSKTRYKGAVWRKGNPPAEKYVRTSVPGLPPDFINLAPDGSTLHHRREHYKAVSSTVSEEDLISKVAEKKQHQDELGLAAEFGLLSSADFAYPESWLAGHCASLEKESPPIYIEGPSDYFDAIEKQIESGGIDLPVVARDFSLYHAGTALTRVNLKIGNRLGEVMLADAEKFSVAASLLGARYPEEALDKAWRQVLFNQHHDGITGTCNDRSYFDMIAGYREALELAEAARSGALEFLARNADTSAHGSNAVPIVVFNSLGWDRSDRVVAAVDAPDPASMILVDSGGDNVLFDIAPDRRGREGETTISFVAEGVPSMGYQTYYLVPGDAREKNRISANSITSGGNYIENTFFRIEVDPERGGAITELTDIGTGRKVIAPGDGFAGNEIIVLEEDRGPSYPAWELSTTGVLATSLGKRADVTVNRGETFAEIVVRGRIPGYGGYRQIIKLWDNVKRIDFETEIIDPAVSPSKGQRYLWMLRFPAKLEGTAPVVEDRFFAAARRRSLMPLSYRTDLEKMYTYSAPYSAMRWVEEGVAVRVDIAGEGGSVKGAVPLMLCEIIHSGSAASVGSARQLQSALIQKGVACTPAGDYEDRDADALNRNFRFVIDTGGDNDFAAEVLSTQEMKETYQSGLDDLRRSSILTRTHSGDENIPPVETLLLGASSEVGMRYFIDEIVESIRQFGTITVFEENVFFQDDYPPAHEEYGIALINRGNLLHSFDNNGTIVMGLFHSAQWAKKIMGIDFQAPEMKNHRFHYSLYPHTFDWRHARTYRVGHEVNTPMTAVVTDPHKGRLPDAGTFFGIESENVVLSAVKAAGNTYAFMRTSAGQGPANGVVMRFYEAEGRKGKARVDFFLPVSSAVETNMLEEEIDGGAIPIDRDNSLTLELVPNEIKTIKVIFDLDETRAAPEAVAPVSEPSNVIYSNYWDYNLGAAYMRNSPVSVDIDYVPEKRLPDPELLQIGAVKQKEQKITKGKNRLRLVVSNNSADESISGNLDVEAPEGWKVSPDRERLELAPLEGRVFDLKVLATRPVSTGYIRAAFDTGDTKWFDTLRVRKRNELDVETEYEKNGSGADRLRVAITNDQGARIDGFVQVISPIETWPDRLTSGMSLVSMDEWMEYFAIDDRDRREFTFAVEDTSPGVDDYFWLMVKIAYNGELVYIPVEVKENTAYGEIR